MSDTPTIAEKLLKIPILYALSPIINIILIVTKSVAHTKYAQSVEAMTEIIMAIFDSFSEFHLL
jgi:hypothetical protein